MKKDKTLIDKPIYIHLSPHLHGAVNLQHHESVGFRWRRIICLLVSKVNKTSLDSTKTKTDRDFSSILKLEELRVANPGATWVSRNSVGSVVSMGHREISRNRGFPGERRRGAVHFPDFNPCRDWNPKDILRPGDARTIDHQGSWDFLSNRFKILGLMLRCCEP